MRYLMLILVLGACDEAPPSSLQDDPDSPASAKHVVEVKEVTVADVVALRKAGKTTIVDVLDPVSREEQGTIPGAIILAKSPKIGSSELPKELSTPLVFYCWDHT